MQGCISMLKHNSQTAMSQKGLGVGKGKEYKDQHEEDWKEPPETSWGSGSG